MARKIVIRREDGTWPVLTEILAENESQLQEIMKANPDLLPIDEFGMTGPLLVVGRETALPSGYIDLLCVARSGELLVIEFKTGPQNADFRHVLAQLLDYGSDLWQLSYEEFENAVAVRFFNGAHCQDSCLRGKTTLDAAAKEVWPDRSEEEAASFREKLAAQLVAGSFHYLVVAQRFTATMERTVAYLNAAMPSARFYAIELVRFAGDKLDAFESRTVLNPGAKSNDNKAANSMNESRFLDTIADIDYREAIHQLLLTSTGLGLKLEWGTRGPSIRVRTSDRPEPLTIGWLYPPGISGWNGLLDLNLGYDPNSATATPSAQLVLDWYIAQVEKLSEIEPVKPKWLRAFRLTPKVVIAQQHTISEILAQLVQQVDAGA